MKFPKKTGERNRNPILLKSGFALIVCLSLMILLALLALGLLSLSSVALRGGSNQSATATARANARLALTMALGELQRYAGKDQSATAESDVVIRSAESAVTMGEVNGQQLRWTGVWESAGVNQTNQQPAAGPPVQWLVSGGSAADPANINPNNSFLIAADQAGTATTGVRVPLTLLQANGRASTPGRYGYWVSDLGVKAKVNIPTPPVAGSNAAQVARCELTGASQLAKTEPSWKDLNDEQRRKWPSLDTGRLIATGGATADLTRTYQHDLTCDGHGLPTDASLGGFKKDLTSIFEDPDLCDQYLGGQASGDTMTVSQPTSFFLLDPYVGRQVGPNWGNLYHYYSQYRLIGTTNMIYPDDTSYGIEIRTNNWEPYNNVSETYGPDNYPDRQHRNSPMTPVVALLRMNFRLGAKEITDPADSSKKVYQLRLHVKPIVALWNPYNFRIEQQSNLSFSWATFPYLKLEIRDSKGTRTQKVWLREIALITGRESYPPRYWSDLIIPPDIGKFEPGETKIYSVSTTKILGRTNTLDDQTLNYHADFYANLVDGITKAPVIAQKEPSATVKIVEMYLDDMQSPETGARWSTLDPYQQSGSYLAIKHNNRNLARFNGLWAPGQTGSKQTPGDVDVSGLPPLQISTLLTNNTDPLVAWEIRSRTSDNVEDPSRMYVEGNPRSLVMNARWDGSTETNGWRYSAPFQGGGELRDGVSLSPQTDEFDPDMRLRGGNAADPSDGRARVVLFDVPRAPLFSLAQFQHANLSRYQFEPTYVAGNSHISARFADLTQTSVNNFAGFGGFTLVDSSYEINRKLWDSYAFSTWSGAFSSTNTTPPPPDASLPLDQLVTGEIALPNPRHLVRKLGNESTFQEIKNSATRPYQAEAIMARIAVDGAFNVNSTSIQAWKTVLAGLHAGQVPQLQLTSNPAPSLVDVPDKESVRFSRFASLSDINGAQSGADDDAFWRSYRKLSDAELDNLARQIVIQVKARGPFRSLAEFVNRNPAASNPQHQRIGALQAALDAAVNRNTTAVSPVSAPPGMNPDALDPSSENQAAGAPGYLTQADVLQTLGPILQPRSDAFRIRAVGQALDRSGTKIVAEAVCEAVVQRTPDYIDDSNPPEISPTDAADPTLPNPDLRPANRIFGRKFQIVSFRWLRRDEI